MTSQLRTGNNKEKARRLFNFLPYANRSLLENSVFSPVSPEKYWLRSLSPSFSICLPPSRPTDRQTDNKAICSPRCKSPSLSIPSPDLKSHCLDLKQDVSRPAAAEDEKQKSFVGLFKGRERESSWLRIFDAVVWRIGGLQSETRGIVMWVW